MIKAVIIEDENFLARDLKDKIVRIDDQIKIIEILPSLKTAKKWFMENEEPDVLFMDIQLGDGVSFEIFEFYEISCPIIFTTAYDEFAVRAFKVNGIDYLLKPINENELKKAIEKCKLIIENKNAYPVDMAQVKNFLQSNSSNMKQYKENFIISYLKHWIPIKSADIAFFYKDKLNYIYKFNGEKYHLDFNTLDEIEELLNPTLFYRANRQFIIHIDSIKSIEFKRNNKLTVHLLSPFHEFEVEISREKAPIFKKWLNR